MITLGYIMGKDLNSDYRWWVNIPTLQGIPDSSEESKLFSAWRDYQSRLKNEEDTTALTAIDKILMALKIKQKQSVPHEPTEEELKFCTLADVCSLKGSKVDYCVGDAVVIGFLDNSLSKPIILGSYITDKNVKLSVGGTSMQLEQLIVDSSIGNQVILPSNTKLGNITVAQIESALSFINSMTSAGFDIVGLQSMMGNINSLLNPIKDSSNNDDV